MCAKIWNRFFGKFSNFLLSARIGHSRFPVVVTNNTVIRFHSFVYICVVALQCPRHLHFPPISISFFRWSSILSIPTRKFSCESLFLTLVMLLIRSVIFPWRILLCWILNVIWKSVSFLTRQTNVWSWKIQELVWPRLIWSIILVPLPNLVPKVSWKPYLLVPISVWLVNSVWVSILPTW